MKKYNKALKTIDLDELIMWIKGMRSIQDFFE
jgi:hypothetical protein